MTQHQCCSSEYIFFKKIEEGKKKPWGNFFKCGADVCLDLRLIALKIYWSKGQGCVRITAEGIKFVEGNKDVSSTGPFQLNGGRWVLLTSRERQWSGCVVWGNNVTRYHWSYWRCVRERKTVSECKDSLQILFKGERGRRSLHYNSLWICSGEKNWISPTQPEP